MEYSWHLLLMSMFYVLAGINHFRKPELYFKIIPDFLVYKDFINFMVGFFFVITGISLLIPLFHYESAVSILLLLIIVFPSNVYMVINNKARLGLPMWLLILRLPLQFALFYWAKMYIN
jgi:uncharacterized membrane protein